MSCYNASRWLSAAIDSVLAQTLRDFEFIVIDDGSVDETWNIIESYSRRDGRILAIRKKNTGLSDSLNVGIAQAKGAWIARLDADDLCEPTRLEEQINFVRTNPEVVLVGTGFVEIDEWGQVVQKHLYPVGHRALVRHLERLQRFFPHSSALFKRDVARYAGCYNPLFQKAQDWDSWLRIARQGRIACLKNYLVRVRKHSRQLSHSAIGMSQLVYGTAAATCHFLRASGCVDPSSSSRQTSWSEFISWIDMRIAEEGLIVRRRIWAGVRADYFASEKGLSDGLRVIRRVLRSGHAAALIREELLGFSLPESLAREWMKRSCAAL
jgi:glycosyltransferase involved in cell wall biosynthesis